MQRGWCSAADVELAAVAGEHVEPGEPWHPLGLLDLIAASPQVGHDLVDGPVAAADVTTSLHRGRVERRFTPGELAV